LRGGKYVYVENPIEPGEVVTAVVD
jgi:hypothetical protein